MSAPSEATLYYNPEGGTKYHADPNCGAVSARYLPLAGVLTYGQLSSTPYTDMKPCAYCAAPQRPAVPAATSVPVYVDGVMTMGYVREEPIDMPSGQDYTPASFTVSTWRGDSFRQNAAAGSLEASPATLEQVWCVTCHDSSNSTFRRFSEDMQPTMIKWAREIRESMLIAPEAKATAALKEVFIPTLDGQILRLNLANGTQTRNPDIIGYPITGSVTLHPLGYPTLLTGQASALRAHGLGHIGMRYISAVDGVTDRFVADGASTAFTTSALIDRNTNTAIFLSSGGWLFTEKLDVRMSMNSDGLLDRYRFYPPQSVCARVSETTVTAAPGMYENLLWLGNNAGQVICVDTTTMQPLWTTEGMLFVSSLAMRETSEGLQLLAVTGLGAARLVCLDPCTGRVIADIPLTLDTAGPCTASAPVVGRGSLDGFVFVNLTGTSDATAGLSALCTIDMEIGQITWRVGYPDSTALSAPVAVYDAAGNGFLVAAMEEEACTTLLLLEGRTGVILSTLTLHGVAPCSPAVYYDMLVITTNSDDGSLVHGVRLAPAEAPAHPDNPEALVNAFMNAWAANDRQAMLDLCAPSWRSAQSSAEQTLFIYCANRTARAWAFDSRAEDSPLTLNLRVQLETYSGREPVWKTCAITIAEEDGQLWIRPEFIAASFSTHPCEPPAEDAIITP